jgi:hypothetical protein
MKSEDLDYFKSFPNISIIYEPRLHAKSYINDSEGIIASMNLYDYSAENNIEYGLAFNKSKLVESVYEDHLDYHYHLLEDSAHCIYIKRPVFKKVLLGLSKNYLKSEVLLDLFDSFDPNKKTYERVVYQDIDVIRLHEKDIIPVLQSRLENRLSKVEESVSKKSTKDSMETIKSKKPEVGFCIRTGEQIPYNPEQPLSMEAWRIWNRYADVDFPENYCHKTGKYSKGSTSTRKPQFVDNR